MQLRMLIFGDYPRNLIILNVDASTTISALQRTIFKFSQRLPPMLKNNIRPSDLAIYNLKESVTVDDFRLQRNIIPVMLKTSSPPSLCLDQYFKVSKCAPTQRVVEAIDPISPGLPGSELHALVFVKQFLNSSYNANFFAAELQTPIWRPVLEPIVSYSYSATTSPMSSPDKSPSSSPSSSPLISEYVCQWILPSTNMKCLQRFESGLEMTNHIDEVHIGSFKKNNLCLECRWPGCDYRSKHRRNHVVSHLKKHIPDANYKCNKCTKRFKRKHELGAHERKYHSVRLESKQKLVGV